MSDWSPHETSRKGTQAAIVDRAVAIIRRPVRLRSGALEVFDADVTEQQLILEKLLDLLDESNVAIIFHTREETRRLYADFADKFPHQCHYNVEVDFCGKRKFFCDLCGKAF